MLNAAVSPKYTEDRYFEYLCSRVHAGPEFTKMLRHLYLREFYWKVERDGNRASDGLAMRSRFFREHDLYEPYIGPCRFLEVLVSLAIRCEEDIMQNDAQGDRTAVWFWVMVSNLGLANMSNDRYDPAAIDAAVDCCLERQYDKYGHGGLFHLKKPRHNLRNVEIWYQMCWYLDEQFDEPLF